MRSAQVSRTSGRTTSRNCFPNTKQLSGEAIRWHFIGHLQSNKVKYIAPWVTMIHALDNRSLAEELDRRARQHGRTLDVLVEVNTTGEEVEIRSDAGRDVLPFVRSLEDLHGDPDQRPDDDRSVPAGPGGIAADVQAAPRAPGRTRGDHAGEPAPRPSVDGHDRRLRGCRRRRCDIRTDRDGIVRDPVRKSSDACPGQPERARR